VPPRYASFLLSFVSRSSAKLVNFASLAQWHDYECYGGAHRIPSTITLHMLGAWNEIVMSLSEWLYGSTGFADSA
jgi:hypothetical protein